MRLSNSEEVSLDTCTTPLRLRVRESMRYRRDRRANTGTVPSLYARGSSIAKVLYRICILLQLSLEKRKTSVHMRWSLSCTRQALFTHSGFALPYKTRNIRQVSVDIASRGKENQNNRLGLLIRKVYEPVITKTITP
jgi:hypothetical protein